MTRKTRKPIVAAVIATMAAAAGIAAGSAVAGGDIYITIPETHKIPDKGKGKMKLTVPVSGTGAINNMFFGFRVEHPQTKDLKLALKSPDGTKTVMSDRDTTGANFGDTAKGCSGSLMYLNSQSMSPLSSGTAPYTGAFAPAESFDAFDGEEAQGDWALIVKDLKSGNKGKLHCFVFSLYTDP